MENGRGQQPEVDAIKEKMKNVVKSFVTRVRVRGRVSCLSGLSLLVRFAFAFQCRLLCSLLSMIHEFLLKYMELGSLLCGLGGCTLYILNARGHENTIESYPPCTLFSHILDLINIFYRVPRSILILFAMIWFNHTRIIFILSWWILITSKYILLREIWHGSLTLLHTLHSSSLSSSLSSLSFCLLTADTCN